MFSSRFRFLPTQSGHWSLAAPWLALALLAGSLGCDESTKSTAPEKAAKDVDAKQQRLEALLQENGLDPSSLPQVPQGDEPEGASPKSSAAMAPDTAPRQGEDAGDAAPKEETSAASPSSAAASGSGSSAPPSADGISIKMLSAGSAPRQVLRYGFQPGRSRKFQLDLEVGGERSVDGRPAPGMPNLTLAVSGTSKTLTVEDGVAKRETTFTKILPQVAGIPPEALAQLQAQYTPLSGIQLIETVDPRGAVLGVNFDQRAIQPQVLALMQQLQDGLTNAYLSLPADAVGVGARWIASTEMDAAGIHLLQRTEVRLVTLEGSRAKFDMTLSQSAQNNKLTGADLPPGVEMEITKVEGKGKGSMSVDFSEILVTSRIQLTTETALSLKEPGAPAPILQASTTRVTAQVSMTK